MKTSFLIVICLALLGSIFSCHAQSKSKLSPDKVIERSPKASAIIGKSPLGYNYYSAGDGPNSYFYWTKETWKGSDAPFIKIRESIDSQVRQGKKILDILGASRREATSHPLDAQLQFRWAYAAFLAYKPLQIGGHPQEVLKGVIEGLEKPNSPQSYEYARIRLLMYELDPKWKVTGITYIRRALQRMLKRQPNDMILKYMFAYDFSFTSNSIQEQDWAYRWAKAYVTSLPNAPQSNYLMGFVLTRRLLRLRSKSMSQQALAYLNKARNMLPKDSPGQRKITTQIDRVHENIKFLTQTGQLKA